VIRTHPRTGKRSLYVHTTLTTRIMQLSQAESDALLQFLFRHIEQPIFQCRWRWTKDAIAFWDNRCTLHQAQWDYFPQRRVGYRVQINGDKPFFRP
jgi:taurine dioxygenase